MPEKVHEEKIPILVLRDDPQGGFQEDTVTTVVTRTWVRVRLRHNLDPGADVVIFNKQNGYQAEFLMDSKPAPNEVKLLLRDQSVDIWQLDFGLPPEPVRDARRRLHLVCMGCQTRETVPVEDYEFEKLERTGRLTRNCPVCVKDTDWEKESVAQARAEAKAREKAEQEQRERAEREARLREQEEAARRAEEQARSESERLRQAAEEAAAKEVAEASRHADAQAAQRNARETVRRLDAELAELSKVRATAERKAPEAAARIPEAESQAEAAAQALIKATKESEEARAKAEILQREAQEAAHRAELAQRRAHELTEKREQAREKAEAARQSVEQARGAQEAAEKEIMQVLQRMEAAAEAKAAALKRFKEAGEAIAKRAAELSKAAQEAAALRAQYEETTTRLDSAAVARLLVNTELATLLTPAPKAAPQPAAVAEGAPAAAPAVDWSERRSSRRIYVKTLARVRRGTFLEVVDPVNVSRGGICFESPAAYELDEAVWVAMHYREGADMLETPSRIVRVSPGKDNRQSYGVKFEG